MKLRTPGSIQAFVSGFFAQAWQHRGNISRVSLYGYGAMALAFALQVVTARLLGVELYGVYAANIAVAALAEVPIVVRSGELAMRAMRPGSDSRWPGYLAIARYLVRRDLGLFITAYACIAGAGWLLGRRFGLDPLLLSIMALSIPAQIGYGAYKSLFFAQGEMQRLGQVELLYGVFLLVLSVAGYFAFGIYGLAAGTVAAALLKTLLSRMQSFRFTPRGSGMRYEGQLDVSRDGYYSIVRNSLSSGLAQIDVILLSQFQSPAAVALYKIGKSLTALPIKISFPLWRVLQPQLMAAVHAGDVKRERAVALKGSFGFVLLMLVMLPPVLLVGDDLIALAYGEPFRGAFIYFVILTAGVWMFQGVAGWFGFWCVITRSQFYGVLVYAVALLVMVAGGMVWGRTSVLHMAFVVSGAMLLAAVMAYVGLFADPGRRRGEA